jgi:hypothetical protein
MPSRSKTWSFAGFNDIFCTQACGWKQAGEGMGVVSLGGGAGNPTSPAAAETCGAPGNFYFDDEKMQITAKSSEVRNASPWRAGAYFSFCGSEGVSCADLGIHKLTVSFKVNVIFGDVNFLSYMTLLMFTDSLPLVAVVPGSTPRWCLLPTTGRDCHYEEDLTEGQDYTIKINIDFTGSMTAFLNGQQAGSPRSDFEGIASAYQSNVGSTLAVYSFVDGGSDSQSGSGFLSNNPMVVAMSDLVSTAGC